MVFFLSLFSCNFDDQWSQNLHRQCYFMFCFDTTSKNTLVFDNYLNVKCLSHIASLSNIILSLLGTTQWSLCLGFKTDESPHQATTRRGSRGMTFIKIFWDWTLAIHTRRQDRPIQRHWTPSIIVNLPVFSFGVSKQKKKHFVRKSLCVPSDA